MIPNLDFIRTMLEGLRESVFARIKSAVGGLEGRISAVDAKIHVPDYAAREGEAGYILNKPVLVGRPGEAEGAEVFNDTNNVASGKNDHAEGYETTASGGWGSHAEGTMTVASGQAAHAEGYKTIAAASYQHVQGKYNVESGANKYAHIVGNGMLDQSAPGNAVELRSNAHTLDWAGNAWFAGNVFVGGSSQDDAAAEMLLTRSMGGKTFAPIDAPAFTGSVSMGRSAGTAVGVSSTAMGEFVTADGDYAHAEGYETAASGTCAHAEGRDTTAEAQTAHAEGYGTVASESCAHSEGRDTEASGTCAHAEGQGTRAIKSWAHAEGYHTEASGTTSHAEGNTCAARGYVSHAEGYHTIAASDYQHVEGCCNLEDADSRYLHIVGNGDDDTNRSNAHTLDWAGNAWFAGTVEGTALILKSSGGKYFKLTVDDTGALRAAELLR